MIMLAFGDDFTYMLRTCAVNSRLGSVHRPAGPATAQFCALSVCYIHEPGMMLPTYIVEHVCQVHSLRFWRKRAKASPHSGARRTKAIARSRAASVRAISNNVRVRALRHGRRLS